MPNSATHDVGLPRALRAFMEQGWADARRADVSPGSSGRPSRPAAAPPSPSVSPGETLVIPTGAPKVRANDTDYPFRPDSNYFWLTGDVEPDDVLVLRDGEATLYVPPRADRSSPAFYADRKYGELWVGPRWGLEETALALDIADRGAGRAAQGARRPRPRSGSGCCAAWTPAWTTLLGGAAEASAERKAPRRGGRPRSGTRNSRSRCPSCG